MKKKFSALLVIGLGLLFSGEARVEAAPASSLLSEIQEEQPSGESFTASTKGDEQFNYVVTNNHEIVIQAKDHYWYYGKLSKDQTSIESTGKKYLIDSAPKKILTETDLPKIITATQSKARMIEPRLTTEKVTKNQNVLVVLVEFSNVKMNDYTKEPRTISGWSNTFFSKEEQAISVANFYKESTGDHLDIQPAKTTQYSDAPGVVKVTLDEEHPDPQTNTNFPSDDYFTDILTKVEPYIDFSQYDTNQDKQLSKNELHICYVFAGRERSMIAGENAVWGHNSSRPLKTTNGYTLSNGYMVTGELTGTLSNFGMREVPSTIGILAHEFGHQLGLPDLYNQDNLTATGGYGLGEHSLMSTGSNGYLSGDRYNPVNYVGNSPSHLDAYSKAFLGVPVELVDSEKEVIVQPIFSEEAKIYKLKENDANERNYYLVENRPYERFDRGRLKSKSSGIAIYHVNEDYKNAGNFYTSTYGEQLVTLLEADEVRNGFPKLKNSTVTGTNSYFNPSTSLVFNTATNPALVTETNAPEFNATIVDAADANAIKLSFKKPVTGLFGTTKWTWEDETQTLTFSGGKFLDGQTIRTIEQNPQLNNKKIKKIVFKDKLTLAEDSSYIFNTLTELAEIEGLANLDTNNVKKMAFMFYYTSKLTSLDLATFDTSKVTDMLDMFAFSGVKKLDLRSFNTNNVTNMTSMFVGSKVESLDLTSFNTLSVKNMDAMFHSTNNLKLLKIGKDTDLSKATGLSGVWENTLTGELFENSPFEQTKDPAMRPTEYIRGSLENNTFGLTKWTWEDETQTLTFSGGRFLNNDIFQTIEKSPQLNNKKIKKIIFTDKITLAPISSKLFNSLTELTEIQGLTNLDTSKVTMMSYMFYNTPKLTTVDLSSFDTSNVFTMGNLFSSSGVQKLDLRSFDTSNVTDMGAMFSAAVALESVDLTSFNTTNVKYMNNMFQATKKLTQIKIGKDTNLSKATGLSGVWLDIMTGEMFENSPLEQPKDPAMRPTEYIRGSLENNTFGLTKWTWEDETQTLTFSGGRFLNNDIFQTIEKSPQLNNKKIKKIIFTDKITLAPISSKLFNSLTELTEIQGLTNLDTSKVTMMSYMFYNTPKLTTVDLSSFDTSNVFTMGNLFSSSGVQKLDLRSFDTSNVTDMGAMFSAAVALESVDLTSFNTTNVKYMNNMFQATKKLTQIKIGKDTNLSKATGLSGVWLDIMTGEMFENSPLEQPKDPAMRPAEYIRAQ